MTVQSAHRLNQEIQTDPHTFYFSFVGTRPEELLVTATDSGRTKWVSRFWARLLALGSGCKGLTTKLVYSALKRLHSWQVGAHASAIEDRFGVAADSWSSAGDDGVLEGYTQSHPRVPEECETPVSVGLPRCRSALKPGVWHTLPVHADHMWAHVDEAYARQVFERLALTLLGLTVVVVSRESGSASLPSLSQQQQQQRQRSGRHGSAATPVRRSARLQAKAQRARSLDQQREETTGIRSESVGWQDGAACRGGSSSVPVAAPGEAECREGSGVRCELCVTGRTATAVVGPDAVDEAFHPRFWGVLLRVAFVAALLLSFLLFVMPNGTTGGKSAGVVDDLFAPRACSSGSDPVGPVEGLVSSGIDFVSPGRGSDAVGRQP
ncbi:unnamed protein product [Ectocarpus fasciculatus]